MDENVAEELENCAGVGHDNMTCILIQFNHNLWYIS